MRGCVGCASSSNESSLPIAHPLTHPPSGTQPSQPHALARTHALHTARHARTPHPSPRKPPRAQRGSDRIDSGSGGPAAAHVPPTHPSPAATLTVLDGSRAGLQIPSTIRWVCSTLEPVTQTDSDGAAIPCRAGSGRDRAVPSR